MGMTDKQRDNVRWVVWIGSLIIGALVFIWDESKDNAKYEALYEVAIPELKEDTEKILDKLEDNEQRWMEQKEWNGAVNAYIRIDVE
jgi:hypothetical protein